VRETVAKNYGIPALQGHRQDQKVMMDVNDEGSRKRPARRRRKKAVSD
jgi:hypothetical protein